MNLKKFMTTAVLVLFGTAVSAAVTFNPENGTGFVGKGDVQLAFGWNNAQAQSNLPFTTYTYVESSAYEAVCTWTTGEGTRGERVHNVTHRRTTGVIGSLSSNVRQHRQIDGIILTGYSAEYPESGTAPVMGQPCPGNPGTDGVWTSVIQTGLTIHLDAEYNGVRRKIWPTV